LINPFEGCSMILLTLFASTAHCVPQKPTAHIEKASDYLQTLEALGWSGSVLVESKGKLLLNTGFGLADREAQRACTAATLFEVASTTKIFTACAIMLLVEQNKIDLDDKLGKHLPGVPKQAAAIQIEHLLSHTSGMPRAVGAYGMDLEKAVADSFKVAPVSKPGRKYEYWNGGYALLAGIVEQVSGSSFQEYCRENILEPAGMASSGFTGDKLPVENQAIGYGVRKIRLAAAHPYGGNYGWQYKGMGGLVTSTTDFAAFIAAFRAGKILKRSSIQNMWRERKSGYGLGWRVFTDDEGLRRVGHGGDVAGFHTYFQQYPDSKYSVVVMSNCEVTNASQIGLDLEALLKGYKARFHAFPEAEKMTAKALGQWVGEFETTDGSPMTIEAWGKGLVVSGEREPIDGRQVFLPDSKKSFVSVALERGAPKIEMEVQGGRSPVKVVSIKLGRQRLRLKRK